MRYLIGALVTLGMIGGVSADETRSFIVHRYAFNLAGLNSEDVAYKRCQGAEPVAFRKQRTGGDLAYTILSLGWYTPVHVTVECIGPTTAFRRPL
jgi:hypothetical protein